MRPWPIRAVLLAAVALALLFAGAPPLRAQQPEELALEAEHGFRLFVESLWPEASAHGISRRTFDRALAEVALDWRALERANYQPEHEFSLGDYVDRLVSEVRILEGRLKLEQHAETFRAVEAAYGVDRHVLAAIWGIESNYGTVMGEHGVVRALGMLAWKDPRRATFGKTQLLAALRIVERGDIAPERMLGSWAGAMGHTQFIPTTYSAHAVDFDKDGRRDIWGTIPDALASTANYLKVSGWRSDAPWGFEVKLPADLDLAVLEREATMAEWDRRGVLNAALAAADTRLPPGPPPISVASPALAALPAALILPAGAKGPAFLVTANFRAILKYNNATSYALAVGHLANRLAGARSFVRNWPQAPEDRSLNRREREELQRHLIDLGFYKGEVDGLLGRETKAALLAWQRQQGLPPDGYASKAILTRLQERAGQASTAPRPTP